MGQKYFVKNIINHDKTLKDHVLFIEDDKISKISKDGFHDNNGTYFYAIPGFIDIHTHGGNNNELMDDSIEALDGISRFFLQNGTTSFLASTITAGLDKTESVLKTASEFMPINEKNAGKGMHAKFLGVHLEGPWLSVKNLGAQNPKHCILPLKDSMGMIEKFQEIVKMVTFSYHSPESEKFLEFLVGKNIIPACGHDETHDERILTGFQKGVKVITHIYCSTSTFQRRNGLKHLGTIEMALMTDGIKVEVVADGRHITKYFWEFIIHNKKYEDIIVITDSIRCAGLPEDPNKKYKLGELDIIIDDGVAWLTDKSCFAGSVATMLNNFRRLVSQWNVPINEAVKITSYNQAILLDIADKVGEIRPGVIADILLLDEDLNIKKVVKSGVEVK